MIRAEEYWQVPPQNHPRTFQQKWKPLTQPSAKLIFFGANFAGISDSANNTGTGHPSQAPAIIR